MKVEIAGRREKKLSLTRQLNPGWKDLAGDWYENASSLDLPSHLLGTALGMTEGGGSNQ